MPTLIEKLWDTKSSRGNGVEWQPSEGKPGSGRLVIDMGQAKGGGKRSSTTYTVSEFAPKWDIPGRAFRLVKESARAGPESEVYSVFIPQCGERGHVCDCPGFTYGPGKKCKHIEAAIALLENRWI